MAAMSLFVGCALSLSVVQPPAGGACTNIPAPAESQLIVVPSAPEPILSLAPWQNLIAEGAQRFGLPNAWIRSVMHSESGGRTRLHGRPITSPKGAMGLMQIMPRTYEELRARYGLGRDPYDPHDNVLAGSAYLRELYDRYGYPNLFAAYNAGPKRFDRYLFDNEPLPDETLSYVNSIVSGVISAPAQQKTRTANALFFSESASPALFVVRVLDTR
jgi:soluble lytic murein transglycosylase-like protein